MKSPTVDAVRFAQALDRKSGTVVPVTIQVWAPTRSSTGAQVPNWDDLYVDVPSVQGLGMPVGRDQRLNEMTEQVQTRQIVLLQKLPITSSMRVVNPDGVIWTIDGIDHEFLDLFTHLHVRKSDPQGVAGR